MDRWLTPIAGGHFRRRQLLAICLFLLGLNSLVFYAFPDARYDQRANLAATVLLWSLLPVLAWRRWHGPLVHLMTLVALGLMTYIASQTGGINSPVLFWLTVVAMPALLLIGPQAAYGWMLVVFGVLLALLFATQTGWVGSAVFVGPTDVLWVLTNQVLCVVSLVLALRLYDQMHSEQLLLLDQRNRQLQAIHEAQLRAQTHKDEFVAAVGHELRTPMNAILGLNSVLREQVQAQRQDAEVVDHIRRSTEQLLRVVNDILDFSQLQADQMVLQIEACHLPTLVDRCWHSHLERASAKGLAWSRQLAPGLPQQVRLDRRRVFQVLDNLIDNAIKFTGSGAVCLRVTQRGQRLRFEVQDSGLGVAPERQRLIFKRFEHADLQTQRIHGGTGLGLSICERLVRLHEGEIGVDSVSGAGAVFWFELPLLEAAQAAVGDGFGVSQLDRSAAFEVLLVDDNPVNLMVGQLQLQKAFANVQVTAVEGAAQALELLAHRCFDLALVDMVMPGMDGVELARRIRALPNPQGQEMPILALTANTHPADGQRCLDAGMNGLLHKPMDPQALVQQIALHVAAVNVPMAQVPVAQAALPSASADRVATGFAGGGLLAVGVAGGAPIGPAPDGANAPAPQAGAGL